MLSLWLDQIISKVFSDLNDSMILSDIVLQIVLGVFPSLNSLRNGAAAVLTTAVTIKKQCYYSAC